VRIIHISDSYAPKRGGIEVQIAELARRQIADGHEVSVITRWTVGSSPAERPVPGPGDCRSPQVMVLPPTWLTPRSTLRSLRELLGQAQPDAVHVHVSVVSPLALAALKVADELALPSVATLHSMLDYLTPLYQAGKYVLGWHRWGTQWSAVSALAAQPLVQMLPAEREVLVLPNGIDPTHWRMPAHPDDAGQVTAVAVMRLQARKRPRALLKIIKDAERRLPHDIKLKVLIVGEGPLYRPLVHEVRRMGLASTVELLGPLDHSGLQSLYARTDLYLAPATLESFGIAALEARCAGIPVIARNKTGITDFIEDGVHGLIVNDDLGFASAIADLASDPVRREVMAGTNRNGIPPSDWAGHLELCMHAYKSAAGMVRANQ
jgi:glycosyltransferase involved in cell wall biosynthesis